MGTEFSDKQVQDKVTSVDFERGDEVQSIEIYYASKKALESMGVKLDKRPEVVFPTAFSENKFCKPPRM